MMSTESCSYNITRQCACVQQSNAIHKQKFIKLSVMHLTTHCTASQPAYQTQAYNFLYNYASYTEEVYNEWFA